MSPSSESFAQFAALSEADACAAGAHRISAASIQAANTAESKITNLFLLREKINDLLDCAVRG